MEFIGEDDLKTFEGWLKYQAIDQSSQSAEQLADWKRTYDEIEKRCEAVPALGRLDLRPFKTGTGVPRPTRSGEYRYAVAVRDGEHLWLTLWVQWSRIGEVFVNVPRADSRWNPHASYHRDGTVHSKSYDHKMEERRLQPLTEQFHGTAHIGAFGGHGPKSVGAVCVPGDFTEVVEVPLGVLGPRDGTVVVDLVEPGHQPIVAVPTEVVSRHVFRHATPWVVITVHR